MGRFIIILVLLVSLNLHSQTVDFLGVEIDVSNVCNSGSKANEEARKYIKQICDVAGVENNFILVECNSIKNCLAILNEMNDPIIMYDNSFLNDIKTYGFTEKKIKSNSSENKDWQALTILAHEIGHHANSHFSESKRKATTIKNIELEADEYAGFIIYKLGGSLQQGKKVYNSEVISISATREHPGRADRIKAFEKGYNKAKGLGSKGSQNSTSSIDSSELLKGHWLDEEKGLTTSFYEDGSYIISKKDKLYKGSWKIEANELILYLFNSEEIWFTSSIIGINLYTLTLKNKDSDLISVLKRNSVSASDYSNNYFKKNWNKLIYIDKYDYTYREIGGLWDINIPLINKTEFVLDLVRIRVDYYLKNYFGNGGVYKTEYLEYNNVKPKQKIILKAPDSDRGTSVKSTIVNIKSIMLNFP